MKKCHLLILLCSFLLLIVVNTACTKSPVPQMNELTGVYQAEDDAIIILREDSTILFLNIDWSKVLRTTYFQYSPEEVSTWKIIPYELTPYDEIFNWRGRYLLSTQLYSEKIGGYVGIEFFIHGENRMGYYPPWNLYIDISDPDDMNRYYFKKIK